MYLKVENDFAVFWRPRSHPPGFLIIVDLEDSKRQKKIVDIEDSLEQ